MSISLEEITVYSELHKKIINKGQEVLESYKNKIEDWNGSEVVSGVDVVGDKVYIYFDYEYECGYREYCWDGGDWFCSLNDFVDQEEEI